MCRIAGVLGKHVNEEILISMRDSLSYGGPDDSGIYLNEHLGLSHRRLSIIDLSKAGHQPMYYKNFVITYNGEIYNYKEIATELKKTGYTFEGGSDTEVILKAFEHWGFSAVDHFRGMFAFAIWNETTKKLLLCRDRIGVKPLYWYLKDGLFMFASELKAFHKHPDFDKKINQKAISLFLQVGNIRSPECIFEYAHKLSPGNFLEIDLDSKIKIWPYWNVREKYLESNLDYNSDSEHIRNCENILSESFNLRMVADVPVGMFLSGGIDSSLVTAILQKDSNTALNTFTIGFENKEYNEANHAKLVASHLKTNHNELYCSEKNFQEIIEELPQIYDEPFADASSIPTYLVSKLAKTKVKVSLSADGGDEIFGGYNRYLFADKLFKKIEKIPLPIRKNAGIILGNLSSKTVKNILNILPINSDNKKNIDSRLTKLIQVLSAKNMMDYLHSSTLFLDNRNLSKLHNFEIQDIFDKNLLVKENQKFSAFAVADIESYLESDILTKIDRASMHVALEGREPFLDHKIIEFAMTLPDNMKIRDGKTKWILRQILYKYIPKELIERPKMGFGIPLNDWLLNKYGNELKEIFEDKVFAETFYLNQNYLKNLIVNYLNGKSIGTVFIWHIYCLHRWYLVWMR